MESPPESRQSGDAVDAPASGERRRGGAGDPLPAAPMSPRSLDECGLDLLFLADLAGKIIFQRGKISLTSLTAHICLPAVVVTPVIDFMRGEHLAEIARRGASEGDVEYQLTEEGKRRAIESLRRCQYAGPAPVTLQAYTETVEVHSVGALEIHADDVHREYSDLVISQRILDSFGAAMNSGRAIFVYGPAGSGKTYMAERLCRLLGGTIAVPHAVVVDGEVIQVFDPLVHKPIPPVERTERLIDRRRQPDARWVICHRPVVMTGGELTLSMLDLHFDQSTRFYQAPPHFKANNGIFIIDDLGRQLVSPRDLMNRWIVPLDRRCDYLALHTGYKFRVPFDVVVVFSTNVKPTDLADEAFLRRLGYKIFIGPVPEHDYREIFERCCTEYGVRFDAAAFDFLVKEMHVRANRPLLACYPRDLVGQIRDFAIYEGSERAMSESTLKRAWASYFVSDQ
ncbi:ATP-binding protein [Azospira restricta]